MTNTYPTKEAAREAAFNQYFINTVASAAVEAAKILIENGMTREEANKAIRKSVKNITK